jgi:hypothetical protein
MNPSRTIISFSIAFLILISTHNIYPLLMFEDVSGEKIDSVTYDMLTESQIILITSSNFTGVNSISIRTDIDEKFGNGDGNVSKSESDNYQSSIQQSLKDLGSTQNTYMDHEQLKIVNTTVLVSNAVGPVHGGEPLYIQYTSGLKTIISNVNAQWHTIVFIGEYYGNNTITLIAPDGWKIANNPKNFQVYSRSDNDNEIRGRVIQNFDAEIKMFNPEKMVLPGEENGDGQGINISSDNLVILIPIILAVIVVVLLLGRKGKKKIMDGESKEPAFNIIDGEGDDDRVDDDIRNSEKTNVSTKKH